MALSVRVTFLVLIAALLGAVVSLHVRNERLAATAGGTP
jgi:hypothetical protein